MRSPACLLTEWFRGAPGQRLLEQELAWLEEILPTLYGYHIVQLGLPELERLMQSSRIGHRVAVATDPACADNAGCLCRADALPFASDSVDVLLLPHVLGFEENPHQVLREAERVLIAEGYLVLIGFNPFSLWGLWRLALGWRGNAPWCGRYLSLPRVLDWLRLLDFEVVREGHAAFRPPLRSGLLYRWLGFMERLGGMVWPFLGGIYVVVAKKRILPLTPVRTRWQIRRELISAGAAEPSMRVK